LAAFRLLAGRTDYGEGSGSGPYVSAEVIVCPQGEGQEPIYIVLTPFAYALRAGRHDGYPVADPDGLFGPPPMPLEQPMSPHARFQKRDDLVIHAFCAEGESILPFGGDNMLSGGVIADLNGDGLVERADHTGYAVDGVQVVQVLHVRAVCPSPQAPLLSVLYNWGEKADWGYQFADRNNDGIVAIEFGPRLDGDAVKPKVVFTWDEKKRAYVGPEAKPGDHFRVLAPQGGQDGGVWKAFERFKTEGLVFPADPEAVETSAAPSDSRYPAGTTPARAGLAPAWNCVRFTARLAY